MLQLQVPLMKQGQLRQLPVVRRRLKSSGWFEMLIKLDVSVIVHFQVRTHTALKRQAVSRYYVSIMKENFVVVSF